MAPGHPCGGTHTPRSTRSPPPRGGTKAGRVLSDEGGYSKVGTLTAHFHDDVQNLAFLGTGRHLYTGLNWPTVQLGLPQPSGPPSPGTTARLGWAGHSHFQGVPCSACRILLPGHGHLLWSLMCGRRVSPCGCHMSPYGGHHMSPCCCLGFPPTGQSARFLRTPRNPTYVWSWWPCVSWGSLSEKEQEKGWSTLVTTWSPLSPGDPTSHQGPPERRAVRLHVKGWRTRSNCRPLCDDCPAQSLSWWPVGGPPGTLRGAHPCSLPGSSVLFGPKAPPRWAAGLLSPSPDGWPRPFCSPHHPQGAPWNCLFPLTSPVKAPTLPAFPQRLAPPIPSPSATCSTWASRHHSPGGLRGPGTPLHP